MGERNAGTGKTHVLTARVLRLLLASKPERILCLTFTKAAATEMSTRLLRLADWASAPGEKLQKSLGELLGRSASAAEALAARALFARAIETPGGLKVQTIHAFCERLLQRFPLEAGVPPGFTILDDEHKRGLIREAIDATLAAAAQDTGSRLHASLGTVIVHAVDERFDRILEAMIAKREWLDVVRPEQPSADADFAEAEARYRAALRIRTASTRDSLMGEIAELLPPALLQRAIDVLDSGTKTDRDFATILKSCVNAEPAVIADALGSYFTNSSGKRRETAHHQSSAMPSSIRDTLAAAQDEFITLDGECRALAATEASLALVRLADAVRSDYAARKARRAALDYEDLIVKAAELVANPVAGAAQWVLYKLDEGLDHILVDEAQDTSPAQWNVIRGLAGEFFADAAGRGGPTHGVCGR